MALTGAARGVAPPPAASHGFAPPEGLIVLRPCFGAAGPPDGGDPRTSSKRYAGGIVIA
jgi:hypothetical protein